jgi:hypothetical protein
VPEPTTQIFGGFAGDAPAPGAAANANARTASSPAPAATAVPRSMVFVTSRIAPSRSA